MLIKNLYSVRPGNSSKLAEEIKLFKINLLNVSCIALKRLAKIQQFFDNQKFRERF
jgi:hypothetical protein